MLRLLRIRRAVTIAALAAALLVAGGCRYFRPAQPEPPSNDAGVLENYSTIDNTLLTLQLAIEDKSGSNGQSAYIGGFADATSDGQGFTATFDPLTVDRFPGQSTDWDLSREAPFYSNLSRLLPTSAFLFSWGVFSGAPNDEIQPTAAVIYRSYILKAKPDEGTTLLPVARGNAELHFILVGTKWKIVQWIDSEDPNANIDIGELSFGHLRLAGP